jgi:hypothetical protein
MNKEGEHKAVSPNSHREREDVRGGAAEEALRKSENKYRSLFMNSLDAGPAATALSARTRRWPLRSRSAHGPGESKPN